jgi:Domain of unknown function (DUF4185)
VASKNSDPGWGNFSNFIEGGYAYMYGDKDQIYLARVPVPHVYDPNSYEVWNGHGWTKNRKDAEPIWEGKYQQGQIWKTEMFHPRHNAKYIFVGNNSWADSKIYVHTAPAPEGPWTKHADLGKVEGITSKDGFRYCMYPHPWAPLSDGELLCSWSEHWPGGVIDGKVHLELE